MNRVLVAGLLFSLVIIIIGTTNHITSVLAQVNSSGLANITNTSSKDTFAASGKISSLIFVHEKASNNTSGMKTTTNNSEDRKSVV